MLENIKCTDSNSKFQQFFNCRKKERVKVFGFFGARYHPKTLHMFNMGSNFWWKIVDEDEKWPCSKFSVTKWSKSICRQIQSNISLVRKKGIRPLFAIHSNISLQ